MREPSPASQPRLADGLLLGAAALLLYVGLWQTTLYQTDGHWILVRLGQGELRYNNHFLYMPLLAGLRELLAPLGIGDRSAALLVSSLGMAVGVALAHAAARPLGLTRRQAVVCATLVAVTPPVLFFATVVEFHGSFFAAAQLAFLLAVRLARLPTVRRAVALGLSTALAFGLHSSGLLLPALLLPWVLAVRWDHGQPIRGRPLLLCVVAGTVHVVAIAALLWGLQRLGFPHFPPSYDQGRASGLGLGSVAALPGIVWQEWGKPYLPLSLLVLPALFGRGVRARAIASVLGFGAFIALALTLLVGRPGFGEYLLPLAMPASVLVVATFRRGWADVAVVATAALAVTAVLRHDTEGPRYRAFAAGVRTLAGDATPFVLVADEHELGALLVCLPDVPFHVLSKEAMLPPAAVAQSGAALPEALLGDAWRQDRVVLLSRHAVDYLRDPKITPAGGLIVGALFAGCRPQPVHSDGFEGWRLQPLRGGN